MYHTINLLIIRYVDNRRKQDLLFVTHSENIYHIKQVCNILILEENATKRCNWIVTIN